MNHACPNRKAILEESGYKATKDYYIGKGFKYDDEFLINAIKLYREIYSTADTWYPIDSPQDKAAFTLFLKNTLVVEQFRQTQSDLTRDSITEIYDTLYEAFPDPKELNTRIDMIVNRIEDRLDNLERKNPGIDRRDLLKIMFSKKEITGIVNLFEKEFSRYERLSTVEGQRELYLRQFPNATAEELAEMEETFKYRASKYKTIVEHKERLLVLAARKLGELEGFAIQVNGLTMKFEDDINIEDVENSDNEQPSGEVHEEDTGDDYREGSKGERYVDFRKTKLVDSISPKARRLYRKLYLQDRNGNPILDDLGEKRKVGDRQVAIVLQKVLVNTTPETFIEDLDEAAKEYPWIMQIRAEIVKFPENRALVYAASKKAVHQLVYGKIQSGGYKSYVANKKGFDDAMVRAIGVNWMRGALPAGFSVVDGRGMMLSKEGFEERKKFFSTIDMSGFDELEQIRIKKQPYVYSEKEKEQLKGYKTDSSKNRQIGFDEVKDEYFINPKEWMRDWIDRHPECIQYLANMLNGLGVDCSIADIKELAFLPIKDTKKGYTYKYANNNSLTRLLAAINKVEKQITSIHENIKSVNYISASLAHGYLYSHLKEFAGELRRLGFKADEVEMRYVDNKDSYTPYSNLNLLSQTRDDLNNVRDMSEKDFKTFLYNNFLQYEGMCLGTGANMKPTGWLSVINDRNGLSPEMRKYRSEDQIEISNKMSHNGVKYADMSDSQLLASGLVEFFTNKSFGIPIMADYENAYYFIKFTYKNGYNYLNPFAISEARAEEKEWKEGSQRILKKYNNEFTLDYKKDGKHDPTNFVLVANGRLLSDEYARKLTIYRELEQLRDYIKNASKTAVISHNGMIYTRNGEVYGSELIRALVDEVLIEVERMNAIEARKDLKGRAELDVYDDRGRFFQIFPEFETTGFREGYAACESADEAKVFVTKAVAEQMVKIIDEDIKFYEDNDVFRNPMFDKLDENGRFENDGLYAKDGKVSSLSEKRQKDIVIYLSNMFYTRLQYTKLFLGGIHQFKSTRDMNKRAMISHAPRTPFDTQARFGAYCINKTHQNALYVKDDVTVTAYKEQFKKLHQELKDKNVITEEQKQFFDKSLERINSTDGTAGRTLESWRDVMIGLSEWNGKLEVVYRRIKRGDIRKKDIDVIIQNIKPLYSGYEHIDAVNLEGQKPVKLTVLHKYSEFVMLPLILAKTCLSSNSTPIRALYDINEKLSDNNKIDIFVFSSSVKIGGHTDLNPFMKWRDFKDDNERKEHGWTGEDLDDRILKNEEHVKNYLLRQIANNKHAIHKLPMKYFGIAASMKSKTEGDAIAIASQAEKMAFSNVEPTDSKVQVEGKTLSQEEARELYFTLKKVGVVQAYYKLKELFRNSDELAEIFKEEIANKGYSGTEIEYALSQIRQGTFAVPLFSPNVTKQVQEVLLSIIKKRLTKQKHAGSNILQRTSIGLDFEDKHGFVEAEGRITDSQKLKIEWDKKTGRIKWVDAYVPVYDRRLKKFADKDGVISEDRIKDLIDKKIIPEELLYFVCYRTPSDAAHSIIPCKIKAFITNSGGDTIILPREIEKFTGHDYDGDKLRCHFKEFNVVDRDDKIVDTSDEDLVQIILGQKEFEFTDEHKIVLPSMDLSQIPDNEEDRNKFMLSKSSNEIYNTQLNLMFSVLTSPEGTQRFSILGGASETTTIAKSIEIIRHNNLRNAVAEYISNNKLNGDRHRAYEIVSDDYVLFEYLKKIGGKHLDNLLALVDTTNPFSAKAAGEAFSQIMKGAKMIAPMAKYNASTAMLQRVGLEYKPRVSQSDNEYAVNIFGNNPIGRLFKVRNSEGRYTLDTVSRILQSSVDNTKDPILGFINQCPELCEITYFLAAAGVAEEDIHILLNQPIISELLRRIKEVGSEGISGEINKLVQEIRKGEFTVVDEEGNATVYTSNNPDVQEFTEDSFFEWNSVQRIQGKDSYGEEQVSNPKEVFIGHLGKTNWKSYMTGDNADIDFTLDQLAVLGLIRHLTPATDALSEITTLLRPDSESGTISNSIYDIIIKKIRLDNFRNKIKDGKGTVGRISGLDKLFNEAKIYDGMTKEEMLSNIGDTLPEIAALNVLAIDNGTSFFRAMFPQVKQEWIDIATEIALQYDYRTMQEGTVRKIMEEMILFQLLNSSAFIKGNPQEEQIRVIKEVPEAVKKLNRRIIDAANNPGKDLAAEKLIGNEFLKNLSFAEAQADDEKNNEPLRLQFRINGSALDGWADTIRSQWAILLRSEEKAIRDLAIDLFKYNMYTNGFSYGMYEFSHMAPISVLMAIPGYIDTLDNTIKRGIWTDSMRENFIHQYYMNHWGDKRFLKELEHDKLDVEDNTDGVLTLKFGSPGKHSKAELLTAGRYVIVKQKKEGSEPLLYRVLITGSMDQEKVSLEHAQKLGKRNRHGQSILQYNPRISYTEIKPVINPTLSYWSQDRRKRRRTTIDESTIMGIISQGILENVPKSVEEYLAAVREGRLGFDQYAANLLYAQQARQAKKSADTAAEKAVKFNDAQEKKVSEETTYESNSDLLQSDEEIDSSDEQITKEQALNMSAEELKQLMLKKRGLLSLAILNEKTGKYESVEVPRTPSNLREARRQKAYLELNKRLRPMMRSKGITETVVDNLEERMGAHGVTLFDTARVTGEGLIEAILISNGMAGEQALPEEFAHLGLDMLGYEHPLVSRLVNALVNDMEALIHAFGSKDALIAYEKEYEGDSYKVALEAAGKMVADKMLLEQEKAITPKFRNIVSRIVNAIKSLFRRFAVTEVRSAINEAEAIAGQLGKDFFEGRLLDDMDIKNISSTSPMLKKIVKDISDKKDLLNTLIKKEIEKLSIYKTRLGYNAKKKAASIVTTERNIKKLRNGILTKKVEHTVCTFIDDGIKFLQKAETHLDEAIESGKKDNVICSKNKMFLDTILGYKESLEAIRQAIDEGELEDTQNIKDSIKKLEPILSELERKSNDISRRYLRKMLAGVYGEEGVKLEIGKNAGRNVSINDMATRADRDISLGGSLFYSAADSGDFVVMAMSAVIREAKIRGREMALNHKVKVDAAFSKLVRLTGSRDQTFMFEYKKFDGGVWCNGQQDDGHLHKTGRYVSQKDADEAYKTGRWNKAQYEYYNTIMDVMHECDILLPDKLVSSNHIVMIPKKLGQRLSEAEGLSAKGKVIKRSLNDKFLIGDDYNPETKSIIEDFSKNPIDFVPIKYIAKGENQMYDDMTDDVASSVVAFSEMANEYSELHSVEYILTNAQHASSLREVQQHSGRRKKIKGGQAESYRYTTEVSKQQVRTRIQKVIEDLLRMQVYGKLAVDEGVLVGKISTRKMAEFANQLSSLSQMALNLPQRISNVNVGMMNVLIESFGKTKYNGKDVTKASGIWWAHAGSRLGDTGKERSDDKLSLFAEKFDLHQNNNRSRTDFNKTNIAKIFNTNLLYAGLSIGEDYMALVTALSIAFNFKVKNTKTGEVGNLWDAYEVKYINPEYKEGAYLALKDGYVKADGSPITSADELSYRKEVISTNFELQGIYNLDDKAPAEQFAIGILATMYRKWVAPAIKRRYGMAKYNEMTRTEKEGYYRTFFRQIPKIYKAGKEVLESEEEISGFFNRLAEDVKAMAIGFTINRKNLTPYEKQNCRKAFTELVTLVILTAAIAILSTLPDKDEDGKPLSWWQKSAIAQLFRLRSELASISPTPILVGEALRMVKSPFASLRTVQTTVNILHLLNPYNYTKEIKSGRYKGHVKAYKYFREFPIISMFKKVENFVDPTPMINYYKNDVMM